MQKFATNETGSLLWYLYSHASVDAAKVTALSVSNDFILISFLPISFLVLHISIIDTELFMRCYQYVFLFAYGIC